MKTLSMKRKCFVFILVAFLMTFAVPRTSYAQAGNPTITASTPQPLTGTTLDGSVVTLTLSGGTYVRFRWDIADALTVSGILDVTIGHFNRFGQVGPAWFGVKRPSDTEITVELGFDGAIDTDATLTFTVGRGAITNYNGPALTVEVPVTAQAANEVPNETNNETEVPVVPKQDPDEKLTQSPVVDQTTATQDHLQGPWLWMVVPTNAIDGRNVDSLAAASNGTVTETHVAQNGVNEGDTVGELQWTPSRIDWSKHRCRKYKVERTPNPLLALLTLGILQDECIDPTVCWANNINNVVSDLGMGTRVNTEEHTAYALINLISPRNQDTTMWVQSGDTITVWLNGNVIHRDAAENLRCRKIDVRLACDPQVCISDPALQESDESVALVKLKTGNNLLLVKIRQHGAYWDMRVRVGGNFTTSIRQAEMTAHLSPTRTQEIPGTTTTVSILPTPVQSPAIGEQLTFSLNIASGKDVAGYQATVQFDETALRYISGTNGDYLPAGAFFVEPKVERNFVKLNAASLAGESKGAGTLATLTFEVIAVKTSTLTLSDVLLTNKAGETFVPQVENAEITEPAGRKEDVNGDSIVNIADLVLVASSLGKTGQNAADVNGDGQVNIADLVLVAGALGTSAAAPFLLRPDTLETFTSADVRLWLSEVQHLHLTDATSQRGVLFLEQLLASLIPKETSLLANYPNPFNPETWIPYQLSKPASVTLTIYNIQGHVVRALDLGHQRAGIYKTRSRAAYWDGRNAVGEPVASGLYFYTLTAGDFTATRKMLIRK